MKRVLAVLMGSAVLALATHRADAVAFAPGQPGDKPGGFERWDANDDGVIDKAEFHEMRKALKKQHREDGDRPKGDRRGKARRGAQRRGGPDGPPMAGPKARPGDDGPPPQRGPAMDKFDRDDRPGKFDRPGRRGRGMRRGGPDAFHRGKGPGFENRRGGKACPECGCDCGLRGGQRGARGKVGPGPRGPMGGEFGMMGPGHGHKGHGRGHGFGHGGEFGRPHGMMGPGADGPAPFMRPRRGPLGRDLAMRSPMSRRGWRQFAQRPRRPGRLGREIGRRLFERFDENDDQFITPDEFPGRPERFDRWDADDDGRIEPKELKREARRRRGDGAQRGERGGRGRRGPRDRQDDEGPRGPRADKTRAI